MTTAGQGISMIFGAASGGGGGGGGAPGGTGFTHVTSGSQDAFARAVDLSSADATGTIADARLANSNSSGAGTYGDATHVAQVTCDAKGRITTIATVAISGTVPGGTGLVAVNSGTASAITVTGDVAINPSTGAAIVNAISGTSPISITPSTLQWVLGAAAPTLSQAQCTSDVTPQNFKVSPQAAYASATTTAHKTPGSFEIDVTAPVSGGNEAGLLLKRGSSGLVAINALAANPVYTGIWFGSAAVSQSTQNYSFLGDGATVTNINAPFGSAVQILNNGSSSGGSATFSFYGIQFCSSTVSLGGGAGVIGISNASTVPTSNPSAGCIAYAQSGGLRVRGSAGAITQVAGPGQGTVNSQNGSDVCDTGFCRTTTSTATQIYSYPTTSGTSILVQYALISRAVTAPTGGAIGDSGFLTGVVGFRNVGGTLSMIGGGYSNIAQIGDASMGSGALGVSFATSGTNIIMSVTCTATGTPTVDHEASLTFLVN